MMLVKRQQPVSLSGPRVGLIFQSPNFVKTIKYKRDVSIDPILSPFGWQFERRIYTAKSGLTAMTELVVLASGFEQEILIPSISRLIVMRRASGLEVGAGPNLSVSGPSLVVAIGHNFKDDELNLPMNLAFAASKSGIRFSFLLGFNLRSDR
jgi:hypothetical protein